MNKRYKKLNKRVCRILRNEDLNGNICCGLVDLWTDWVDPGKVSSVNTWRVTRFFNAPPFKTNYERVQGVFWQQKQCEANLEKWRVVLWLGINKISGEWDPPPSPQHTARHSGGAETGSEGSGITLDPLTLLWGGGAGCRLLFTGANTSQDKHPTSYLTSTHKLYRSILVAFQILRTVLTT